MYSERSLSERTIARCLPRHPAYRATRQRIRTEAASPRANSVRILCLDEGGVSIVLSTPVGPDLGMLKPPPAHGGRSGPLLRRVSPPGTAPRPA